MRAERLGDGAAYEWLLEDVARALRLAVARRMAQFGLPSVEAEDIVQEALIGLHVMRRHWQADRPFLPWLHAIVRYKLTDAVRRRSRETRHKVELTLAEWAEIADRQDDGRSPLAKREIDRAMAALTTGQRDVVQSVAIDGDTIRDAAGKFGASEGTIRMTMHRALKKLSMLAEREGEHGE